MWKQRVRKKTVTQEAGKEMRELKHHAAFAHQLSRPPSIDAESADLAYARKLLLVGKEYAIDATKRTQSRAFKVTDKGEIAIPGEMQGIHFHKDRQR